LDIINVDFGLNGNSGKKALQSHYDAMGNHEDAGASSTSKDRQLNVLTDRGEYKSNGQTIISSKFVINQVGRAIGIRGNKKIIMRDYILFLDYPRQIEIYNDLGQNDQAFFIAYNIDAQNTTIALELPPPGPDGKPKEAYSWQPEGKNAAPIGKTHISQPVKTTNTSKPVIKIGFGPDALLMFSVACGVVKMGLQNLKNRKLMNNM
jgi:hypothetical protein